MVVGGLQLSQHLRMNQVPSNFAVSVVSATRMLEQVAPLAPAPLAPEILCISAEAELCVCRRVAS